MSRQDHYQELRRELDADRLIQIACEMANLSDFGGKRFYEPLRKLLNCAAQDVDFHAQGLEFFKNNIVRALVNRLRMQDDIKRHPEILQEDVSDPIIIIGLPRSGTTKLHKMLSAPDSVQKTLFWRLWNPAPFPHAISGKPDPRIAAAGTCNLLTDSDAVVDAAHHIEEQEVDEDWMLYSYTFEEWVWCQFLFMPSYFDWVMSRPSIEPFRYVKTMLQYLQWQDGGRGGKCGGRPWVLKAVGYIAHMDSLIECYPNATLVQPHRHPRETVPSYAKFIGSIKAISSSPIDPHVLGAEEQRNWSIAMNRYLEARDRLGLNERILDVEYEQVRNDPMSIMKNIYARAGLDLSSGAERKMSEWHANNEQGRYGKHEYSLEEFGLTETSIDNAFGEYIRRFID